jgi:hypothetical protein
MVVQFIKTQLYFALKSSETNLMPTTITSAGITFNDATTLTSANIGTAQLVNGSVTAEKLGTTEQKQIAKAWVNFDGTLATPITPRASYNVSSITKNGTGDYTVNFATAMADANYAGLISFGYVDAGQNYWPAYVVSQTTTGIRVYRYTTDLPCTNVAIFGN